MKDPCPYCSHVGGHAHGCPEADEPDLKICECCLYPFYDGDTAYLIDGAYYCEDCINDFRMTMDYGTHEE